MHSVSMAAMTVDLFMERTIIYLIMLLEKSDSIHVFISHV